MEASRARLIMAGLLVAACLALLPAVFVLLELDAPASHVVLTALLSMGLGWAAGLLLERRRAFVVVAIACLGVLALPVAWFGAAFSVHVWFVAAAAFSLGALLLQRRVKPA